MSSRSEMIKIERIDKFLFSFMNEYLLRKKIDLDYMQTFCWLKVSQFMGNVRKKALFR